jgi:hypothetical protein
MNAFARSAPDQRTAAIALPATARPHKIPPSRPPSAPIPRPKRSSASHLDTTGRSSVYLWPFSSWAWNSVAHYTSHFAGSNVRQTEGEGSLSILLISSVNWPFNFR